MSWETWSSAIKNDALDIHTDAVMKDPIHGRMQALLDSIPSAP
jgi:hypothetical protein